LLIEDIIPITVLEPEQAEPEPETPNIAEIFDIVDDDIILDDELIFIDDIINIDDEIPFYTYLIDEEVEEKEDDIFVIAEEMPTFRGGDQNKFTQWVQRNVNYPQEALANNIQGKVYVNFVVEADGSVSNVRLTRSVDPALDKEAQRVVGNSPKWNPGKQIGAPVRIRFTITVNFQLQ
jgi:protein TonB